MIRISSKLQLGWEKCYLIICKQIFPWISIIFITVTEIDKIEKFIKSWTLAISYYSFFFFCDVKLEIALAMHYALMHYMNEK